VTDAQEYTQLFNDAPPSNNDSILQIMHNEMTRHSAQSLARRISHENNYSTVYAN